MNHQEQTAALKQQFAILLAAISSTETLTPGSDAFRAANDRLDREGEHLNRAVQRIWRANKCAEIRAYGADIKAACGVKV